MLKAFVGIVSQQGIEVFCPEDPATVRFLWRRVQRERGRTACFWSVIPSEAVELIESTLNLGLAHEALDHLQQLACDYGILVPHHEETSPQHAAGHRG
ncbi:MAG: hypothetical protein SGJ19_19880 [Planctomycetia bacterium]|nr:hypothetical protein [Planctomycetia bacterium]